jgi:hypothetical protein
LLYYLLPRRLRLDLKEALDVPGAKEGTHPEEVVRELRDADATLNAGKELAVVPQTLQVSEATLSYLRALYGG